MIDIYSPLIVGAHVHHTETALAAARARHPTRFATDRDPEILDPPASAWINEPPKENTAA